MLTLQARGMAWPDSMAFALLYNYTVCMSFEGTSFPHWVHWWLGGDMLLLCTCVCVCVCVCNSSYVVGPIELNFVYKHLRLRHQGCHS